MRASQIRTIILAGVLMLAGIIALQMYWVQHIQTIQKQESTRQLRQDKLLEDEFNDRVRVSLSNVAQHILRINNDPAEVYKAVEQLSSNYFVVHINDTLHPYLLENLLIRELGLNNITEDFQYGIYDCFTDSIVYGDYISQDTALRVGEFEEPPQIKWENDGHYFSVRFPNRDNFSLDKTSELPNAYGIAIAAVLLALLFFTYAILVIIKQKKLSEMRNDFISNMTHELKTPISTIRLSGEMLQRREIKADDKKVSRYAEIILSENLRLENQVERVLQIARLERGKITLNLSVFDLGEMLEECTTNFVLTIKEREGVIRLQLHQQPLPISADKVHLYAIVNNLIDNAIKYSHNALDIYVEAGMRNETVFFSVNDKGIGIPAYHKKHIFGKFYRVPSGNVHNTKGYGLGLYYVKLLVDAHQGQIEVESREGKGSTFTVFLPNLKST